MFLLTLIRRITCAGRLAMSAVGVCQVIVLMNRGSSGQPNVCLIHVDVVYFMSYFTSQRLYNSGHRNM